MNNGYLRSKARDLFGKKNIVVNEQGIFTFKPGHYYKITTTYDFIYFVKFEFIQHNSIYTEIPIIRENKLKGLKNIGYMIFHDYISQIEIIQVKDYEHVRTRCDN